MTILITGANRGIGRALRQGWLEDGQEVIGTCRGTPPEDGNWIELDVTQPPSIDRFARDMQARPVDLLVCNAGVYPDKGMHLGDEFGADVWAHTFSVNVTGVFLTIQAMLPNLQGAQAPRIAILGSSMGSSSRAAGGSYAYRASKAAVLNLGRNLAADLEPLGIAVGVYHPGWVQTDMGGPDAGLTASDIEGGLRGRIDALSLGTTGCFESWDGVTLAY